MRVACRGSGGFCFSAFGTLRYGIDPAPCLQQAQRAELGKGGRSVDLLLGEVILHIGLNIAEALLEP